MDVKYINPFIESFDSIMPQLGLSNVQTGDLSVKTKEVITSGVLVLVGIVGDIKGNVAYRIDIEDAKKIAGTMMCMEVSEFDDMAKSAISELANMLTATAATAFASSGISIDISTPTLLHGENISVKMSSDQILCIDLKSDGIVITVNISFQN